MERESNSMQALCRSGCGFYGSPATDGLCSLCFKENLKKKQQLPSNTPSSLSYRDTSTAQPTISHLPSPTQNLASNMVSGEECGSAAAASAAISAACAAAAASSSASAAELCAAAAAAITNHQQQQQQQQQQETTVPDGTPPSQDNTSNTSSASSTCSSSDDKNDDRDAKKKKNRCASCRKKVGLTGFECRCGGLYCAVHRYSDKHQCQFDYRELGAQEIRRNNPVVVGEKIQKI
nr:unnamed protein product [Callosobruchus analis]CAI5848481.1 unnamed protein product [Callosobruchus analis]